MERGIDFLLNIIEAFDVRNVNDCLSSCEEYYSNQTGRKLTKTASGQLKKIIKNSESTINGLKQILTELADLIHIRKTLNQKKKK